MRRTQDLSFKSQNYTMAPDLLNLIRTVRLNNEVGLAEFMSFLLIVRVPADTLVLRRTSGTDGFPHLIPKERNPGIRIFRGEQLFLVKFERRKNIRRRCITGRPCLRKDASAIARLLCPIHMMWARTLRNIGVIGRILPPLTSSPPQSETGRSDADSRIQLGG